MVKEIKLNNMKDIQEFNNIASEFGADVAVHEGQIMVDAKSLLGLLTLDISKPVDCVTEDEHFYKRVKKFLVQ